MAAPMLSAAPVSLLQRVDGPDRITVGIVDAEVLVRAGIRGVLHRAAEIVVVGEARDGSGAVELVRAHRPRVLLIDTTMPSMDVPAFVRLVRRQVPDTRVLPLAAAADSDLLVPVLRAGAAGFLRKEGEPDELLGAVRAVAAGDTFLCASATRSLIDHVVGDHADRRERARTRLGVLTPREREVLNLIAAGLGNAKIARHLCLSEGSIKAYVSRMLTKLRCDNRVQVALLAHDAALP